MQFIFILCLGEGYIDAKLQTTCLSFLKKQNEVWT